MNRKPERDAKLLAELFHDNWSAGPAADYARAAAAIARRRRQLRRTLAAGASAAAVAALWMAVSSPRQAIPTQLPAAPQPVTRGYEIISDEELLGQLRDRPVLVVRKPNGTREITLLDAAAANALE
ncbi:MAG: hypothetical protein Q7S40_19955 [Opitutaceae bacterium]|nr:hypothetical protein [Opitutaceae bacterium]